MPSGCLAVSLVGNEDHLLCMAFYTQGARTLTHLHKKSGCSYVEESFGFSSHWGKGIRQGSHMERMVLKDVPEETPFRGERVPHYS